MENGKVLDTKKYVLPRVSVIDEHSILGIKNLFYQKLEPLFGKAAHV